MLKNQLVFNGELDVTYLLQKSYKKTENLVIIFSGMPADGKTPSYNYMGTLNYFDCNKLFILDDFGCRGSYYLCKNQDYSIERSVISLINYIIKENNIKTVLTCGSSKGGYAALYYGIKYGFDYIISASPQFYLGDYLLKQSNSKDVATFISGDAKQNDHEYLNQIMYNVINETSNRPNIFIHLGAGEPHYNDHVKPLLNSLKQNNLDYTLDLGDYCEHNDVGVHFPPILRKQIAEILGYPLIKSLSPLSGEYKKGETETFVVETDSNSNRIAWYLLHNKKIIHSQNYSNDNTFIANFTEEGTYQIKAFAINVKGMKVSMLSKPIIIENNM
ncbi:Two component regulator three Y domain-containing protein [Bacillus mycoides]|uniref:Two component regulator three Y domain-containing protein n=1 Tax=Bacillus cereus group TaxID=86661 RepID=UPI0002D5E4BE|nr:Two component regulator three Y domain-containing protein [Bacillus mycoides]